MPPLFIGVALIISVIASQWFSTLSYALRDLSRTRLQAYLEKHHKSELFESIISHTGDLIFITAVLRLLSNLSIFIAFLRLLSAAGIGIVRQDRQAMGYRVGSGAADARGPYESRQRHCLLA